MALGGPVSLVDDAGRMASELVASAIRHTDVPVELAVDADDDMVSASRSATTTRPPRQRQGVSFELREASTAV